MCKDYGTIYCREMRIQSDDSSQQIDAATARSSSPLLLKLSRHHRDQRQQQLAPFFLARSLVVRSRNKRAQIMIYK